MENLFEKLIEYSKSDFYPFHMPGHKRTLEDPFSYDITEIEGFDNLHNPKGIIKDIMQKASKLYGSKTTYLLVNGSTCGILSGICASTSRGGKILVARNCHKSVYNGVFLKELDPIYVYPELIKDFEISGKIKLEDIKEKVEKDSKIESVIITSPTFEGVVSEIKEISDFLHSKNIPLIVDEAHGAHFGMHPRFLPSALKEGADIVIQSVHKTLPSLTQSAILHFNSDIVSEEKLKNYLQIYQSSSPSYVLMASIERVIELLRVNGEELFNEYLENLDNLRKKIQGLKNIKLFENEKADISKIVISVKNTNISGKELYKILLEKYHIQVEMHAEDYIIAMTSFCDTKEGFERLYKALYEVDSELYYIKREKKFFNYSRKAKQFCSIHKALDTDKEEIMVKDSLGRVSGEYKYMYPPGIPIIVPGEIISSEIKKACEMLGEKIIVLRENINV